MYTDYASNTIIDIKLENQLPNETNIWRLPWQKWSILPTKELFTRHYRPYNMFMTKNTSTENHAW